MCRNTTEASRAEIVVIEEAAEVLETLVFPCIGSFTEHLILLGDHLQLRLLQNTNARPVAPRYALPASILARNVVCIAVSISSYWLFSSRPNVVLYKMVIAEFIGTFILIFVGRATTIVNQKTDGSVSLLGLAASGGLAIMILILSTGHIFDAHVNPSLTLSFAALRQFPWIQVSAYMGDQALGSIGASFTLKLIFHPFLSGGVTIPLGRYAQAFALEFIITFNLMFMVTEVATDARAVGKLAGIVVGATTMTTAQ